MKMTFFALVLAALFLSRGITQERKQEMPKMLEPPIFWTDIANNEKLETWRRGLAIHLLFERHAAKDITLGKLAEVMNKPMWMKDEDVSRITYLGGWIPLEMTPGDTMFCIVVFPNQNVERHNKECIGIYLNVSGEIDRKDFLATIKGQKSNFENTKLKAWAISPTWNEYVKRIPR
jgi:hypothetical protein